MPKGGFGRLRALGAAGQNLAVPKKNRKIPRPRSPSSGSARSYRAGQGESATGAFELANPEEPKEPPLSCCALSISPSRRFADEPTSGRITAVREPIVIAKLADYTAAAWLREQRRLDPPTQIRSALGWNPSAEERQYRRKIARILREAINERDWMRTFDGLGWYGPIHFRFLERAFPHMSKDERAFYLRYAWCHAKTQPSKALRLRLLGQAKDLGKSVPTFWSARVQLYRGARWWSWPSAQRRVRTGISWTIYRDIALTFAQPISESRITVGCIGEVSVPRRQILAYFPPDEDYAEHECTVDPSTLPQIKYERIEIDPKEESRRAQN